MKWKISTRRAGPTGPCKSGGQAKQIIVITTISSRKGEATFTRKSPQKGENRRSAIGQPRQTHRPG